MRDTKHRAARSRRQTPLLLLALGLVGLFPVRSAAQRAVVSAIEAEPIRGAVWAVVRPTDGPLFVGSSELGMFDGDRWQKIEAEGAAVFRALAATPNGSRIYVGAVNSLGYVEAGPGGPWRYVSLLPELQKTDRRDPLGDVWSVFATERGAIWITDNRVIRYTVPSGNAPDEAAGGKFESFNLAANPRLNAFRDGDSVLVYELGVGLWRFDAGGPPRLVLTQADLPGQDVTWLVCAPRANPAASEEIELIGSGGAAYRRNRERKWERLDELSTALAGTVPTGAVRMGAGAGAGHAERIAIATFKGGIVLTDRDGKVNGRISSANGLPDDSINALWPEKDRLWAALGSGLVRIDGPGEAVIYNRESAFGTGIPVKVVEHGGNVFALTTKGLYEINRGGATTRESLTPLLQGEARLWDVASIGHSLWVGGFGGAWRHDAATGTMKLEHAASADVFLVASVPQTPATVLAVENYAQKLLVESPYGWATKETGVPLRDTPVSLVETEMKGLQEVWIATLMGSVYRFCWREMPVRDLVTTIDEPQPRLAPKHVYLPGQGLPAEVSRPQIAVLGGKVIVFKGAAILRLDEQERGFEPLPGLDAFRGLAAANPDGNTSYWVLEPQALAETGGFALWRAELNAAGTVVLSPLEAPGLDAIGAVTAVNRTHTPAGDELWFSGSRGLLRLTPPALSSPALPPGAPLSIRLSGGAEGTLSARQPHPHLPPETKRLDFRFATPAAAGGELYYYQTYMDGIDPAWSQPSRVATRQFGGLAPGHYEFRVRVLDRFGRSGPVTAWPFVLEAPWYRRPAAFAAYAFVLLLLVMGGVRWQLARLRRANEKLNRLVSERTRELELSNTAKSEFLENISHELRNPLNGMMGMIGQLHEDRLLTDDRELLRTLRACSAQMAQAFEDVLGFSKLEFGYVKVERKFFRLRPTLDDILALLTPAAKLRGCTLEVVWPDKLLDGFVGDPGKIKTVVGNFVSNALKYAPHGRVTINVEVQPLDLARAGKAAGVPAALNAAMTNLLIEVTDQGPGIPPEEQGLIFHKFVRGAGAKKVAGTGLGLATCHVLAKLMNGSVGVDSTPGQGATFYLRVLVAQADPAALAPSAAGTDAAENTAPLRALVVEDEKYNQAVLQGIAARLGLVVEGAENAEEAKRRLEERDYQIVFLDWELPGTKGDEVARWIRARPAPTQPVILATTAHDSDEIREKCQAAGMDGFLLKPYNFEKVQQALMEASDYRFIGKTSDATPASPHPAGLDLEAFDHYARARPEEGSAAGMYCEAVAGEIEALEAAVRANDPARISSCAHRLRALGGLIGAQELNEAATRLEGFVRHGSVEKIAAETQRIAAAGLELCRKLA